MNKKKNTKQSYDSAFWKKALTLVVVALIALTLLYFFAPSAFNQAMSQAEQATGFPFTEILHADDGTPQQAGPTIDNSQNSQTGGSYTDDSFTETGTGNMTNEDISKPEPDRPVKPQDEPAYTEVIKFPKGNTNNQVVNHQAYSLSYADEYEQAEWVFYLLTKDMVKGNAKRTDNFVEDPSVNLGSALSADYSSSGYDRGHLCPAADMRHTESAQQETFYMSNMSPQAPQFNRGIWKKLEEQVRDWVMVHDSIYVATGPVLKKGLKRIGRKNKVTVPEEYYKILYTPKDGGHMIGFLLPNEGSDEKITYFIESVDKIEKATGIDFFSGINNEATLEGAKPNTSWWGKLTR